MLKYALAAEEIHHREKRFRYSVDDQELTTPSRPTGLREERSFDKLGMNVRGLLSASCE